MTDLTYLAVFILSLSLQYQRNDWPNTLGCLYSLSLSLKVQRNDWPNNTLGYLYSLPPPPSDQRNDWSNNTLYSVSLRPEKWLTSWCTWLAPGCLLAFGWAWGGWSRFHSSSGRTCDTWQREPKKLTHIKLNTHVHSTLWPDHTQCWFRHHTQHWWRSGSVNILNVEYLILMQTHSIWMQRNWTLMQTESALMQLH